MPRTFQHLDETEARYHKILDVMGQYHGPLKDAEVKITARLAYGPKDQNGDTSGPALTHGGHQAMATIRIVSLKDRAIPGMGDAILDLDGDRIDELSEATFTALLDHEIHHLELVIDKHGAVVRDDLGRPKLKLRKHDIQIGGFSDVIAKHKQHALEAMQVESAYKEYVQPAFNFG